MKKVIIIITSVVLLASIGMLIAYSAGAFNSAVPFDKDNRKTWFDSNNKISMTDAEKIEKGMTFEEVVAIIGRPARDVGSGAHVLEWDIDSGKILYITFNPIPGSESAGDLVAYIVGIK